MRFRTLCVFILVVFCWELREAQAKSFYPISSIDVSPDGRTIAFSLYGKIWLVAIEGGSATRLTQSDGWEDDPKFSGNGQYIAFSEDIGAGSSIAINQLSSGKTTRFPQSPVWVEQGLDIPERWSGPGFLLSFDFLPGSNSLLVSDIDDQARTLRLLIIDIFDGSYKPVDGLTLREFAISPDGCTVLDSRNFSKLTIFNICKKERSSLDSLSNYGVSSPQFSASGGSVFFIENNNGMEHLKEVDLTSMEERVITSGLVANRKIAVHPNGREVVMLSDGQIHTVNISDGSIKNIPITPATDVRNQVSESTIIRNVQLFAGTGESVEPSVDVLVQDGLIRQIKTDQIEEAGARIINGKNYFLMSGLVDTHAHVGFQSVFRLSSLLNSGITSIVDPSSIYPHGINLREAVRLGYYSGPHMHLLSNRIRGERAVNAFAPDYIGLIKDPDLGRQLVRRFARLGFDGIKLYSALPSEVGLSMIDEAHKSEMMVTGHLGGITWREAVDADIDVITHASLYYICDTPFFAAGNRARTATPPDLDCLRELFSTMAVSGISFDPTLVQALPQLRPGFDNLRARFPSRDYERELSWIREVITLARELGVNITIGRDDWKWSFVHEMAAYEKIGIPRADILRMATINAAKLVGNESEFGTIEVGKRADLILVDGNPLKRISDLRNITLVMKEGEIVVNRLGSDATEPGPKTVH